LTITYHAGRRIQGLAKVGGATYTPTIETAKWTLTNNGGSATIANNALTIVANSNGDNPIATYDLGATISDTKWLMTFQVVYSGFQNSASGQGTKLGIGIGSSSSTTNLAGWNTSGMSFIEYDFRGHASTSVWQPHVNGGNSSGRSQTNGTNYADGGGYSATHYVKLYRLTSTTAKMEFYLQSDYSDTPVTLNVTMSYVPSGLRYVFARSEYENVPDTNTFVISNFQIYNDSITVLPITTVGDTKPLNTPLATGGTITTNGNKKVHTFTSSGTFTPTSAFAIEYLVVAGGGGGGKDAYPRWAGGGGGGGFRTNVSGATSGGGGSAESAYNVTSQSYTINVGDGGQGGGHVNNTSAGVLGANGVNSSIVPTSGTSIISLGGGGGGGHSTADPWNIIGENGGSGGGGIYSTNVNSSGDTPSEGTSGQGYGGSQVAGGGAGSAGEAGNPSSGDGSDGGSGVNSNIDGNNYCYGAGGGGQYYYIYGTSGTGGCNAGNAPSGSAGTNGTDNYGGGGGGGSDGSYNGSNTGGDGGSGIVIISYESTTNALPNVVDGSIFYAKDTNKEYVLYNGAWSEL